MECFTEELLSCNSCYKHVIVIVCIAEQGKRMVIYTAFFSNLHYMFAGALLAALGVCLMHYCGMLAMWGAFDIE
jgi:NO-binding membrane sensor protein with MHYT domain